MILSKNDSAQPKCLHWAPYLSASRSGNCNFFIPSFSAKHSVSAVQSRAVCLYFTQAGRKGSRQGLENVYLRHVSHLKQPKTHSQEVRGVLSDQVDRGLPLARPRREDKLQHTSSSLSWQRLTSAPGTLFYKLRSRVELGGWVPVEQGLHHYHFHHWKRHNYGTCNPEYSKTGHAEAMAAFGENAPNR